MPLVKGGLAAKPGDRHCFGQHRHGYLCGRAQAHTGDHMAWGLDGEIVRKWRGGKHRWDLIRKESEEMKDA